MEINFSSDNRIVNWKYENKSYSYVVEGIIFATESNDMIFSIMGYADTLLEGDYNKETQDKFLNVIATEARRMAKLVTDLLT